MQWVPAPSAGLSRTHLSYRDSFETITSKLALKKSNAYRARFEMEFPVQSATGLEGIDVFNKFASGFYGDGVTNGKIIFADPYSTDNLFPPEWASPGLWERGWSRISDADPTAVTSTAANAYSLPPTSVNYTTTGEVPDTRCWIAVPPGYTLYWGLTGQSMVATRGLGARAIAEDGTYGSITYAPGVDVTDPARMQAVGFAGDSSCVAVEFFIYGINPGTLPVTSMMARLFKTGVTPSGDLSTHQHGLGHHGLEFTDDAMPSTYEYITGTMKGLSTALEETL